MIKNEKQYSITKKKLNDIHESIERILAKQIPSPSKEDLIVVSLKVMREQLENEIHAYESLRMIDSSLLSERSIDNLADLLIEYKIRSGMTQKEFSQKVGMKEQQLQRYEAEDFRSITLKNLLRLLHAIGLEITIKGVIRHSLEGG